MDLGEGFVGFAEVADVVGGADGFFGEAEELVRGRRCGAATTSSWRWRGLRLLSERGDGFGFGGEEVVAVAGGGEEGGAVGFGEAAEEGGGRRGRRRARLDVEEGGGFGDEVGGR